MGLLEGFGLLFKTSFLFLCAEVGDLLSNCEQLWNWSYGWTYTHVNFLSGPALEDFLQSLDPHHRSLTSPIHADGQQWEVGKREGVVKSAVFYCWSRRRSLLDNILVVS